MPPRDAKGRESVLSSLMTAALRSSREGREASAKRANLGILVWYLRNEAKK